MTATIQNQPIKWHGHECQSIPGFSRYLSCRDGSIVTLRGNKLLKPDCRKLDGRKRYTLRSDAGKFRRKYGSYFTLIAWSGDRPVGTEACHRDGDCTNDAEWNLRWDTPVANKGDMLTHQTRLRGEKHPKAKVSDEQAKEIIRRRHSGELGVDLAREFGITQSAVSYIFTGKRHSCLA